MKFRTLLASVLLFATSLTLDAASREITDLNSNWRFQRGDNAAVGGTAMHPADPIFNDADWQTISIPHCWGWEDAQQGKSYYHGPGWYRRELNIGAPKAGRRYFLRFEAAGSVADVYVNGKVLGQHRGA